MFRSSVCFSWICACLPMLFEGTYLCNAAPPKKGKVVSEGVELPREDPPGNDALEKKWKSKPIRDAFNDLINNGKKPDGKDMRVIKLASQWHVFRVTWVSIQKPAKKTQTSPLQQVHNELHSTLLNSGRKANPKFMELFTREMVQRAKEVFAQGNLQGQVNAALMLPRIAQAGRPELIDDMLDILTKTGNEEAAKDEVFTDGAKGAIKLYAIKALKELFEKGYAVPANPADIKIRQERFAKTYKALRPYFDPKPPVGANATRAERREIYNVARFFRREAIRVLGQMRQPAVVMDSKAAKVEDPIAYQLARVLSDKAMVPSPSLSEQLEAAVGLCQMRTEPGSLYQHDLALYLVCRFVQTKLAVEYNADWENNANIGVRAGGGKGAATDNKVRSEPWKLHAVRLENALEELEKATAKEPKVKGNLQQILPKMRAIFKPMNDLKPDEVKEIRIKDLGTELANIKPKNTLLFKGIAKSQIILDDKADE
jgi:hypothetical protein